MTAALEITCTLSEPIVLTDGTSEGQQHETLDYIPGTVLLGACASQLGIKPGEELFKRLFLSDATRFLNAYPVSSGQRTLPVPLSLAFDKADPSKHIDRSAFSQNVDGNRAACAVMGGDAQPKSVRGGFLECDGRATVTVARRYQTHIGMDRGARRAEDGKLFGYESLEAGQVFCGAILTEDIEVADALKNALDRNGVLHLGRSRSAGYGRVVVSCSYASDFEDAPSAQDDGTPEIHRMTLLSDYCGRPGVSVWDSLMAELSVWIPGFVESDVESVYTGTRVVRGFKGIWGLSRPAIVALSKGTVLKFRARDISALQAVTIDGLGLRRNEGFGRFVVDWTLHEQFGQRCQVLEKRGVLAVDAVSGRRVHRQSFNDLARAGRVTFVLKERMLERKVAEICSQASASKRVSALVEQLSKSPMPSNHQLSNLRNALGAGAELSACRTWFDSVLEKTPGESWKSVAVPSLVQGHRVYLNELVRDELISSNADQGYNTVVGLVEETGLRDAAIAGFGLDESVSKRLKERVVKEFVTRLVKAVVTQRNIQRGEL